MAATDNMLPVKKDSLTTDYNGEPRGFYCVDGGSLLVTWNDDTTSSYEMNIGDAYRFFNEDCKNVQVTSGTFIKV